MTDTVNEDDFKVEDCEASAEVEEQGWRERVKV